MMQNFNIQFDNSPWFLLLSLLMGAIYAFVLYQKKGPWPKNINYLLAGARFILVSLLCFLLIGPFIRQIKNTIENPTYVFAIDNSMSVTEMIDSVSLAEALSQLQVIKSNLEEEDYQTMIKTFQDESLSSYDQVVFDYQSTNLSQMLDEIRNNYEGKKLGGVVILTDGIFNLGMSPAYKAYNFPIYSIAMGDTVPKADINLRNLYYNKITYQGNKFPLIAELASNGFIDEQINVQVFQNNQLIESQRTTIQNDEDLTQIKFELSADQKGMQHYQVLVEPLEREYSQKNNEQHAYIDVVEGKENVLIISPAPHPDIKAIRSALQKNENYQVELLIASVHQDQVQRILDAGEQEYDLVIFHQVPNKSNIFNNLLSKFNNSKTSSWFILGNQTDLIRLSQYNDVLNINVINNEKDNVTSHFNESFSKFTINQENKGIMRDFPPVTVPFGKIEVQGDAEILLYQRIGNIETNKPLLALREFNGRKTAVLIGEGIWKWRLQEYAVQENHQLFDEMVSKLVQFLSSKEDRRKFKVYPVKNEFFDTESVVFENEIYNDIYERIYGFRIDLTITDEQGNTLDFTYVTNENNSKYQVSDLKQGVYQYQASTQIDGETVTSSGEFSVQQIQVEMLQFTANHDLLRSMADQTNGGFYFPNDLEQLSDDLLNREMQGVIYASEEFMPIINMPWIFFVLISLVSLEWFTRKYHGGY